MTRWARRSAVKSSQRSQRSLFAAAGVETPRPQVEHALFESPESRDEIERVLRALAERFQLKLPPATPEELAADTGLTGQRNAFWLDQLWRREKVFRSAQRRRCLAHGGQAFTYRLRGDSLFDAAASGQ